MQVPEHLHGIAGEVMALEREAAINGAFWAVVLGLKPVLDGDQYCLLWGGDIQSGVAGFGKTALDAVVDFDTAMRRQAPRCSAAEEK